MSNDTQLRLSRRKVLAGLGTIGIASAGAGLGTTAFFSDQESVSAELQAGRLDLLVDYRATYNPWLTPEEITARQGELLGGRNFRTVPDDSDDGIEDAVIVGEQPVISVLDEQIVPGMPDGSVATTGEQWASFTRGYDACDNPDGLTYVDGDEGESVMFTLTDVKPKDWGEATISLHLCDNDAYLWAHPFVTLNDDVSSVEPELSNGDTEEDDQDDFDGELADYLWVNIWYDENCNNVKDEVAPEVDILFLVDVSGSMLDNSGYDVDDTILDDPANSNTDETNNSKLSAAKATAVRIVREFSGVSGVQLGLASFGENGQVVSSLGTALGDLEDDILGLAYDNGDDTRLGQGLLAAQAELDPVSGNGNANADQYLIVMTNGLAETGDVTDAQTASDTSEELRLVDGVTIYGAAFGNIGSNPDYLADEIVSQPPVTYLRIVNTQGGEDGFVDIFAGIADAVENGVTAEVCIYKGSLGGLAEYLNGASIPLSPDAEDLTIPTADEAVCFPAGVHCLAFEWYVPCFLVQPDDNRGLDELGSSHPAANGGTMLDELIGRGVLADADDFDINVIQTDALEFGLDLAGVQCRHNMNNTDPFVVNAQ